MSTEQEILPVELRRVIQKRDAATRSMDVINKYIGRFNPEVHSINHLQVRLDKLNEIMLTFNEYQTELELNDKATADMYAERDTFEDNYCTIKATILDLIDKNKQINTESIHTNTQTVVRDTMKLPSIPAPSFDGSLQNWASFLDTFNAMFHNNDALADVQRLHYLKSCLTGSAAEVIRTIPTTEENYHMAYSTLVERYKNKSLIIQSHIRSLFATPPVCQPFATELRKLHHHIVSQVRALKALNQPVENWDAWLVTLVCSKLDAITVGE